MDDNPSPYRTDAGKPRYVFKCSRFGCSQRGVEIKIETMPTHEVPCLKCGRNMAAFLARDQLKAA